MRHLIREYVRRPQNLWLRKAIFQIHLWLGLLLTIYVVMVGVSGSILVLRHELQEWTGLNPQLPPLQSEGHPLIGFSGAADAIRAKYPKARISFLYPPREENPGYYALVANGRERLTITVHPYSGEILLAEPPRQTWLTWVGQMHYFLLLPSKPGIIINGIGSALLILMTLTGLVLWWPGIRQWMRAFTVDFRRSWKRVNWDLHNVTGFWTLSIVLIWAISGVYLVWPREFTAAVNRISPVSIEGSRERRIKATENKTGLVPALPRIEKEAPRLIPDSHIGAVSFPVAPSAPLQLYMVRSGRESLSGADFVYYDSMTGAHLKTSIRSRPKSAGDWVIWLMAPLHFGTYWGFSIKILWFVLGFSLPLLAVTGVLMYWNRYLSRKWVKLKSMGARSGESRELVLEAHTERDRS